ncbi:MAG: protein translocase subunit SecD [Holosporaceae bacterium]|jgi:preprotein translocase subunit SecD|nr:protein translocase subunit SecD [Holosporaceae bacterium]
MHFPRWKEIFIWCVCAFGVLFALPNTLPTSTLSRLPDWLPRQKVSLGLDLSGGAHLLLEVDLDSVRNDYLNQMLDAARTTLRKENIPYAANFPKAVARDQLSVEFDLKDDSAVGKAKMVLGSLDKDFKVEIIGTHVKMTPEVNAIDQRKMDAIERSIEIVRKRVDETGTREINVQRQGEDRILLQIPGLQDASGVKEILGRTAKLTFRLVDEDAPEVMDRKSAVPPVGCVYLKSSDSGKYVAVKKQAFIGGETLVDARIGQDEYSRPMVSLSFNRIGAKKFGEITSENVGKRFAIVLDDKIISTPVIKEAIMGGHGSISSDHFSAESANELALLLRAGALPAPLNIIEEKTVGPDLGADSIRSGVLATFVSGLLVLMFMYLWYSSFGIIANVAVVVNLILLLAGLSCLGAALTLPGIAGIALTVGMAVDANVLINERIKESLRRGAKWVKAVEDGYQLAMTSIVDSNLNTIIGMCCLYQFGTGPVKGFAITTILGTVISFFTSTTLTRYVISLLMKYRRQLSIPM